MRQISNKHKPESNVLHAIKLQNKITTIVNLVKVLIQVVVSMEVFEVMVQGTSNVEIEVQDFTVFMNVLELGNFNYVVMLLAVKHEIMHQI